MLNKTHFAKGFEGYLLTDDDHLPKAVAELFCNMLNEDQAKFFNMVQHLSAQWPAPPSFQWRMMENHLTPEAREMIKEMYDHTDKADAA